MKLFKYAILSVIALSCFSCSDDDDSALQNDWMKKTAAPAIVGEKIEFAYAMGTTEGQLSQAEAKASIAGAEGTNFESYSWFTARAKIQIGDKVYQAGEDKIDETYMRPNVAYGTNQVPMIAVTLRYAYVVPEEAKGQNVSFTFSSTSSTGAKASCSTQSYKVSKMDMRRLIEMESEGACYFSIADMKAYTKEEVAAQNLASKIDFIYLYQETLDGYEYKHSFVSPATDPKFIAIAGIVPTGATNKTPMEKRANVRDAQLKGDTPNVYIDDIDFQTLDLGEASDYALTFNKDDGAFMKTADGKYAAYVYVNNIDNNGKMTVSIKRYPL